MMSLRHPRGIVPVLAALVSVFAASCAEAAGHVPVAMSFPPPLESYGDAGMTGLFTILRHRIEVAPLNLWVTLLFLGAVIHTFFTAKFHHGAANLEKRHRHRLREMGEDVPDDTVLASGTARLFHFLGEVEAVFGIWVVPLLLMLTATIGLKPAVEYVEKGVNYEEPLFVVIIMAISSTRPVLRLAEQCLAVFARMGGNRPQAWWLAILTIGPVLGSFITEPAAMTISALLLGRKFYVFRPSRRFAYATLGLLFVNISVGGTLTNFAAPPVLMVTAAWKWDTIYMMTNFGWIAVVGIVLSTALYFLMFRKEFAILDSRVADGAGKEERQRTVPAWITIIHLLFMAVAVFSVHRPAILLGSFLFFLAFFEVTEDYQEPLQLRSPILVGFFLAGLVIHGGLQQWWIAPVLGGLNELPLMFGAMGLTAVNDNAAITYLSTLVPNLSDAMKHAVMSGAVVGGGLTVIANAPNPAGQSILKDFFEDGISPVGLLQGALLPTALMTACFILLPATG